jgi:putative membrane protein
MSEDSKTTAKATQSAVKHSAKVVEQHSKKIADSAKEIKSSSAAIETSADRTTQLAADRTILAAERTYAAWVRTGLFSLASGIGARALLTGVVPEWIILANGTVLILFSMFCFGAASWRQLYPGAPPPTPDVKPIPRAVLATINGFLALVSLAALIGIWTHSPR